MRPNVFIFDFVNPELLHLVVNGFCVLLCTDIMFNSARGISIRKKITSIDLKST